MNGAASFSYNSEVLSDARDVVNRLRPQQRPSLVGAVPLTPLLQLVLQPLDTSATFGGRFPLVPDAARGATIALERLI